LHNKFKLLAFICIVLYKSTYAQTAVVSQFFNQNNGLSNEQILALYHDLKSNYLYIGHKLGLSVFDGSHIYNLEIGREDNVNNIFKLNEDTLLIVKSFSLVLLNTHDYGFIEHELGHKLTYAFMDACVVNRTLYLANELGLYSYVIDKKQLKDLSDGVKTTSGERIGSYYSKIMYDSLTNSVWLTYRYGIVQYDLSEQIIYNSYYNPKQLVIFLQEYELDYMWRNGNSFYFLNSKHQLSEYSFDSNKISTLRFSGDLESFGRMMPIADRCYLLTYQNEVLEFIPNERSLNKLPYNGEGCGFIFSIDANEKLFAIAGDMGLRIFGEEKSITYPISEKLNINYRWTAGHGDNYKFNEYVYIVTSRGIVKIDTNDLSLMWYSLSSINDNLKLIYSSCVLSNSEILISGFDGYCVFNFEKDEYQKRAFFKEEFEEELRNLRINVIYFDSINNRLLAAPYRSAVYIKQMGENAREYKWKGSDYNLFRTFRKLSHINDSTYLIGANGGDGVMFANFNSQTFKLIHARRFFDIGLLSPVVSDITFLNNHYYFATAYGLAQYNPKKDELRHIKTDLHTSVSFTRHISVIGNELFFTDRRFLYKLGDNQIEKVLDLQSTKTISKLFTLRNKIVYFYQGQLHVLENSDQIIDTIQFTHIFYENKIHSITPLNELKIPFTENEIILYLSNRNYLDNAKDKKFYYKRKTESDWQLIKDNKLVFNRIGFGEFEIEAKLMLYGKELDRKYFVLNIAPPWWFNKWFLFFCLLVIIGLISLGVGIKLRKDKVQKQKEIDLILSSIEFERKRLKMEFHDGIVPNLSSWKLIMEAEITKSQPEGMIRKVPELIDQTIKDIRNLIEEATPEILNKYGLHAAIKRFIDINKISKPNVEFELESNIEHVRFDKFIEFNLLRITQESIQNSLKHTNSKKVIIKLNQSQNQIELQIRDFGTNSYIDLSIETTGMGINNIYKRIKSLNGKCEIDSQLGKGTIILIRIPI